MSVERQREVLSIVHGESQLKLAADYRFDRIGRGESASIVAASWRLDVFVSNLDLVSRQLSKALERTQRAWSSSRSEIFIAPAVSAARRLAVRSQVLRPGGGH